MGNDIGTGLLLRAICFDFRSTNVGSSVIGTRSATIFYVITQPIVCVHARTRVGAAIFVHSGALEMCVQVRAGV